MAAVQHSVTGFGPHQSSASPPTMGNTVLTKASALLMTPNCALLTPSCSRSVFLSGPSAEPVHVCPMGSETTQSSAIHLYDHGIRCSVSSSASSEVRGGGGDGRSAGERAETECSTGDFSGSETTVTGTGGLDGSRILGEIDDDRLGWENKPPEGGWIRDWLFHPPFLPPLPTEASAKRVLYHCPYPQKSKSFTDRKPRPLAATTAHHPSSFKLLLFSASFASYLIRTGLDDLIK